MSSVFLNPLRCCLSGIDFALNLVEQLKRVTRTALTCYLYYKGVISNA